MVEKYEGYVFATVGIHPEFVKEISEEEMKSFFNKIEKNREKIVGIGEQGLDYYWIKEDFWREKQKELFRKQINLAHKLKLPIVTHARDSAEDAVKILEEEGAKRVLLHMFGAHHLLKKVVENGWMVSLNTIVLKSKKYRKVNRDS